ncbi:MAG TPA: hypothetical protein VM536_14710, partial [Chloroflexia bacterium]|nr:hypothetical protein [Chloroflexia bacterium]
MNVLAEDGSAWRAEFVVRARPFSTRWRRARLLTRAASTAWLLLLSIATIIVLTRFTLVDLDEDTPLRWLPLPIWALFLAVSYLLDRPAAPRLARIIDQQLDLDERLGTAVALSYGPLSVGPSARLIQRQRVDALEVLEGRGGDAARDFKPRPAQRRAALLAAAVLAGLLVPIIWLPSPLAAARAERAAVQQASAAQADRLAQVRREAVARPELPDVARDLVDAQLASAEATLRMRPADRAANVGALSQTEEQLRTLLPDNFGQVTAAHNAAGRDLRAALGALIDTPPEGNTDLEKAASAAAAAGEQLVQAGAGRDSSTPLLGLAGTLDRVARTLDSTDPVLAAKLRESAAGLRQGTRPASAVLDDLAAALREAAGAQAATDILADTLSQVQEGKQQIAEAGLTATARGSGPAGLPLGRVKAGAPNAAAPGSGPGTGGGGASPAGGGPGANPPAADAQAGSGSASSGAGSPNGGAGSQLGGNVQGGGGTSSDGGNQAGTGTGTQGGTGAGGSGGADTTGPAAPESVYVPE